MNKLQKYAALARDEYAAFRLKTRAPDFANFLGSARSDSDMIEVRFKLKKIEWYGVVCAIEPIDWAKARTDIRSLLFDLLAKSREL